MQAHNAKVVLMGNETLDMTLTEYCVYTGKSLSGSLYMKFGIYAYTLIYTASINLSIGIL